ncbi:MAG: aspartate aminotransferase family protein [Pseudomonadales bacterium]|nr:aspartate aminotransferase family protein [Pseudomonadales bacterium]
MASNSNTVNPLMPTYNRLPVAFERGEGVWLFDTDGNRYLDALAGIGVVGLGHCHPAITKAINYQSGKLIHTSNIYNIPLQTQLGLELTQLADMETCFFGNSGAEAVECAIKIARLHGHKNDIDSPNIIVMDGSFHGRTLATLSATANRKVHAGFEPLVGGFVRVPFNDVDSIKTVAENNKNVVAILVEPIQGEGGINCPDDNYLKQLRELCDQNNWLLILDEIQTGNGRTGKYFAYQHYGILPDVVTTAKGLGNGMPIGVCMARNEAANTLQPGNHGSTYGGNPLACAAALAVIDTLKSQNVMENAHQMGTRMRSELEKQLGGASYCKSIRGKGLMLGIELDQPCGALVPLAKEQGLLINVTADSVIRLLPPLILTEEEADLIVDSVCRLVKAFVGDDRQVPRANDD